MEIKSYRLKNYDRFFINRIAVITLIGIICLNYIYQFVQLDICFKYSISEDIFILIPLLLILGIISLLFKNKILLKVFLTIITISFVIQGYILISLSQSFFIDTIEYVSDFSIIVFSFVLVFSHLYILYVIVNLIKLLNNDLKTEMKSKSSNLKNYDSSLRNRLAVIILISIICLNYVLQYAQPDIYYKYIISKNIFILLPLLLIISTIFLFFKNRILLIISFTIIILSFAIQGLILLFQTLHQRIGYGNDFSTIVFSFVLIFFHSYILDVINNLIKSLKNDLQKVV